MNAGYMRKLVSDEFREILMFLDLVESYHCKTKVLDNKGKCTHYSFDTRIGECKVYSPKMIHINTTKCNSLTQARKMLYNYITI